jgi:hypothetical protein
MKIVFLDVDGVLNHCEVYEPGHIPFTARQDFHPDNVAIANTIIREGNAKICVSSDWRSDPNIEKVLHDNGIVGEVIGVTCRAYYTTDGLVITRGHEIDLWLRHDHEYKLAVPKHYPRWPDNFETPESFVILDDTPLFLYKAPRVMAPEIPYITERLVQIKGRLGGLTEDHIQPALDLLNTPFIPPWKKEEDAAS